MCFPPLEKYPTIKKDPSNEPLSFEKRTLFNKNWQKIKKTYYTITTFQTTTPMT